MHYKKNIKLNIVFNYILIFSNLLFPLITSPYISSVLGAENIGKVNFANTIAGWFSLLSNVGITTYGVREVAKVRDDNIKLSKLFSELILIKIIAVGIVVILYAISISCIERLSQELLLFEIVGVTIILNLFSLDWFYQGIEEYGYITTRNIILKIISIIAMFIFVKHRNDYIIYGSISVFALSFNNVLNFIYSRKFVKIKFANINLIQHVKPLGIFFISAIVISIYNTLDQIFVGFMNSDKGVAYFSRAKQLLLMSMGITLSVSNVIMPRLTNHYETNKDRYNELLRKTWNIMCLISIPMCFGIVVLARDIMYLFGGNEFIPATNVLISMAPLIIIVPLGTWNYQQRVLPTNNEKLGMYTQIIMAIVSVVLNFALIPKYGFVGAGITYLVAESVGGILGFIYMRKYDKFDIVNKNVILYFVLSILMGISIVCLKLFLITTWLNMFLCIIVGCFVYFVGLIVFKEPFVIGIIKDIHK